MKSNNKKKTENKKKNGKNELDNSLNINNDNTNNLESLSDNIESSTDNVEKNNEIGISDDDIIKKCKEEIEKISSLEKDLEEKINSKKDLNIIEKRLFNDKFTSFWNGHTNGWD